MTAKRKINVYKAEHGQSSRDVARMLNISMTEYYGFLKGSRVVDVRVLRQISNFTCIPLGKVQEEYLENMNTYMKSKGFNL